MPDNLQISLETISQVADVEMLHHQLAAYNRAQSCDDRYQALDFYRKYGYTIFGQLDGLPPGHARYYLRKTLA
jgi:hypothetical protein